MLANLDEVYDPSHATLALYWSRVDLTGFFPRGALLAALALLAAGGAWLSRTRATLVLASLAAATLPLAMLIWDSDALEFERHAIVVPVLARVAVLGLLVPVVDAVAARVADQRGEYAAVSIPK
jgi:hypothetical protein